MGASDSIEHNAVSFALARRRSSMSNAVATDTFDPQAVAQLDVMWGNPDQWTATGLHWTHLPEVLRRISERVTGDPALTTWAWFFQHVGQHRPLPLGRVLVLGCGHGHLERAIARHGGLVDSLVAVDLSPQALAGARAQAEAEGLAIEYRQADMNQLPLGQPGFEAGSFDAVLGVSGVHHCEALESLYDGVATLLKPGGWFFLDEYVGPTRFQWTDGQLRLINELLDMLPPRLRMSRDGRLRAQQRRPTIEEMISGDASEAVRSAEIVPLLDRRFEVVSLRPYGGSILQVLLAEIAQHYLEPAERPYLDALLAAEDELHRSGRLDDDFACVIARVPDAASAPSTAAR